MDGFFAGAGRTAERLGREATEIADALRSAELPAQARVAQAIAECLARLAFDASRGEVDYARISENAHDCAAALDDVEEAVGILDGELAERTAAAATELRKLAQDALSSTQPIDP